jgi:hypothetical protein
MIPSGLDSSDPQTTITAMSISNPITDRLAHGIDEALERASRGERDPEKVDKAIEEMNRMREELRKRIGTVNVAVDLIRDARRQ